MPASRFLVQTDEYAFRELKRRSTMRAFATNLSVERHRSEGRHFVPLSDPEATIVCSIVRSASDAAAGALAERLGRRFAARAGTVVKKTAKRPPGQPAGCGSRSGLSD